MKRIVFSSVLTLIVVGSVFAQAKRTKPPIKPPVIRATVTVKGDDNYKPPAVRRETDAGIWNLLSFPEHGVKIELPSKREEVFDEVSQIRGGKLWEYSSSTEFASYRLFARDFPALLDNNGIEETLGTNFARVYSDRKVRILSKKTLSYGGVPGLEIEVQEKDMIQKARFYILNKKLFALYVTVEPKKHWPSMEKWADRFLDSFKIQVQSRNES